MNLLNNEDENNNEYEKEEEEIIDYDENFDFQPVSLTE
jgi:hypothetical protein